MFPAIEKGSTTKGKSGHGGKGTMSPQIILVIEIDSCLLLYYIKFSFIMVSIKILYSNKAKNGNHHI